MTAAFAIPENTSAQPQPEGARRLPSERAALYRWLGQSFQRECDHGALTWYRSAQGRSFLDALATDPTFVTGASRIQEAILSTEKIDDVALRLAGSFATLFHGVDPVRAAPPYESHYRAENGLLYGESTTRMQDVLSRHGLVLIGFSEPADHIAVHLQMMAHLANLMAGQAATDPGIIELETCQAEFLATHLGDWVDAFCKDCIRFDRSGFYAGLAEIMLAFLTEERLCS